MWDMLCDVPNRFAAVRRAISPVATNRTPYAFVKLVAPWRNRDRRCAEDSREVNVELPSSSGRIAMRPL